MRLHMPVFDRRRFLQVLGGAGAAVALSSAAGAESAPDTNAEPVPAPPAPQAGPDQMEQQTAGLPDAATTYRPTDKPSGRALVFFTAVEAAFVGAAIERFIPADDGGPGAGEAGVLCYIDRQLAGSFGAGHRMYLGGPWPDGALPSQGYQLPLTPADLYRLAIAEIHQASRQANGGKTFAELSGEQQEAMLQSLDKGELHLPSAPGKAFLDLLLANTVEGYFGDPAYGGNGDLGGWKMIGFPGARGNYADAIVLYRNKPYDELPLRLVDLQN